MEIKCCQEKAWKEAHCTENLIGQGCTVRSTTATVTGLKEDQMYYFRIYAVYKNWTSAASASSRGMRTKSGETGKPYERSSHRHK